MVTVTAAVATMEVNVNVIHQKLLAILRKQIKIKTL